MSIDISKLKGVVPDSVLVEIPFIIEKYNVNNPLRLAHLLAQCACESGNFKIIKTEDLWK